VDRFRMGRWRLHPPRFGGDDRAGIGPPQLPAELVDETVVAPAQDAAVGQAGFAAVDPMDEVMCARPLMWRALPGSTRSAESRSDTTATS
jgi:hypothetical protein